MEPEKLVWFWKRRTRLGAPIFKEVMNMFCPNCGMENAADAGFCSGCGARLGNGGAKPADKNPGKKKSNILVWLIVLAGLYCFGHFLGESSVSDPGAGGSQTGSVSSGDRSLAGGDSIAYDEVFSSRNIVPAPGFFGTLDSAAYVCVDAEGSIDHLQFGYEGDVIAMMMETVYLPVEGMSDADIQALDQQMLAAYGNSGLDFVTVSSSTSYSYYSLTVTMRDLDELENIHAAVSAGLLTVDGTDSQMSMSSTESALLAQGYIKE